jgi:hypothetical protein
MKYYTRIITSEDQVPPGYVSLTEYRADNPSEAKLLSGIHGKGEIEAVKLMRTINDHGGRVWVDKKQADAALAEYHGTPEARSASGYVKNSDLLAELRTISGLLRVLVQSATKSESEKG